MPKKRLKMTGHSIKLLSSIVQQDDGSIVLEADILIHTDEGTFERPIMHGDPKTKKIIPYMFHLRKQK